MWSKLSTPQVTEWLHVLFMVTAGSLRVSPVLYFAVLFGYYPPRYWDGTLALIAPFPGPEVKHLFQAQLSLKVKVGNDHIPKKSPPQKPRWEILN